MKFNESRPSITKINNIDFSKILYPHTYRLTKYDTVYNESPIELRQLLSTAPITPGKYKRVLVDIKIQDLSPKVYSCLVGWHLDGKKHTGNKDENTYHILTYGGAPTEFIDGPIELPNTITNQNSLARYIPCDHPVYKLPEYVWNTYTERDWHRGVNSSKPLTRIFIRIVETNYLKPKR